MANPKGEAIVIMGVTASGKSTVGRVLANSLNCNFLDADDFHPHSNKEKMGQGIPLSDEDRIPWLKLLRDALRESLQNGKMIVLGCSALQKQYREILRSADADFQAGSYESAVRFVLLEADADVLAERLKKRAAEGKHFMSPKLLQSQLESLQIDDSESVPKIDSTLCPEAIVNNIRILLSI